MNPKSNELPMQLPAPVEQAPNQAYGGNTSKSAETVSAGAELGSSAGSAPMPTTIPMPTPPVIPSAGQSSNKTDVSTVQGNPSHASDDTDLIEKEWVNKAKQIVENTKDNPYQQSEELNVYKADYMKKRYNRAIKLK